MLGDMGGIALTELLQVTAPTHRFSVKLEAGVTRMADPMHVWRDTLPVA